MGELGAEQLSRFHRPNYLSSLLISDNPFIRILLPAAPRSTRSRCPRLSFASRAFLLALDEARVAGPPARTRIVKLIESIGRATRRKINIARVSFTCAERPRPTRDPRDRRLFLRWQVCQQKPRETPTRVNNSAGTVT